VILHCSFEELTALTAGAHHTLARGARSRGGVAAPPRAGKDIEALLPRLTGDLSIQTIAEQQSVERAVARVLEELRERVDATILEQHVGAEDAVVAYFDYAHVLTLHDRLRRLGREMAAIIELVTGRPPTPEAAAEITFPDD